MALVMMSQEFHGNIVEHKLDGAARKILGDWSVAQWEGCRPSYFDTGSDTSVEGVEEAFLTQDGGWGSCSSSTIVTKVGIRPPTFSSRATLKSSER